MLNMKVDRRDEEDSTILCAKAMGAKEVGEVERTQEDDFHLSGLELLPNSHVSMSRPITLEN